VLGQVDEALEDTEFNELLALLLDERLDDTKEPRDDLAIDDEERVDEADDRIDEGALDETRLDETAAADEPAALQIAPVTTGVSTAPLVLTCIPKDTVCPGGTLPFQLKLDAL
jgi:hypothetical protein